MANKANTLLVIAILGMTPIFLGMKGCCWGEKSSCSINSVCNKCEKRNCECMLCSKCGKKECICPKEEIVNPVQSTTPSAAQEAAQEVAKEAKTEAADQP